MEASPAVCHKLFLDPKNINAQNFFIIEKIGDKINWIVMSNPKFGIV
jgi:hypothetical protein